MDSQISLFRKKRTDWIITWEENKIRWVIFYFLVGLIVACLYTFVQEIFFPLPVRNPYSNLVVLVLIPGITILISILFRSRKRQAR